MRQYFFTYVDLNLGCPQEHAFLNNYGAYLLPQTHWPLLSQIISSLTSSLLPSLPISAKLRLCTPDKHKDTLALARLLEHSGASWITLHARTVSMRRRRAGPADLGVVKTLKKGLSIPVVSNGNVRVSEDLERNFVSTGADGMMVGETLLGNPLQVPTPVTNGVLIIFILIRQKSIRNKHAQRPDNHLPRIPLHPIQQPNRPTTTHHPNTHPPFL